MKTDSFSNQLRWVVLLLAAAVILPTVCLLWFMNQAVENEHLAVSTKLSSILNGEIHKTFNPFLEWINTENLNARKILAEDEGYKAFSRFTDADTDFQSYGLFICDAKNKTMLFPVAWDGTEEIEYPQLQKAIQLEFAEKNLDAALAEYRKVEELYPNTALFKHSVIGQGRIYEKKGNDSFAYTAYERAFTEPLDTNENWNLYASANLKTLYLLEKAGLQDKENINRFNSKMINLLHVLNGIDLFTSEQRIFFFDKAAELAEKHHEILSRDASAALLPPARKVELLRQSLSFINDYPDFLKSRHSGSMLEPIEGTDLYALNLYAGSIKAVRLINLKNILNTLSKDLDFTTGVTCRILDSDGNVLVGPTTVEYEPFLESPLATWLDLKVEFYDTQQNSDIFLRASQRQASIYLWTGFLMVLFLILVGSISIHSVNRQIKMNRLKNDFIATVTHELKTPLSSMRLLVDTLLEGRYKDEQTVTDYLQLVSNENKRLTHLIDSFLTFSRMERNKQVFDIRPVSPKVIAHAAIEAMQAKLSGDGCQFKSQIAENLPSVNADTDGMVTVLVNLLDNAWKYTNGQKQIKLDVYAQNGKVCFAVSDNGMGMPRRIQKKIFNRFYQVDSRLSRRTEGCGLGLSIVRFIVDAHKGTIEVNSELNKGSTFVVTLDAL